jgi:hypothetical protein
MRRSFTIQGLVLTTAWFGIACGGATALLPASPSPLVLASSTALVQASAPAPAPAIPSLIGDWIGNAGGQVINTATGTAVGFGMNCSQKWQVLAQTEAAFSGGMSSQGQSPDSDWRCTYEGRFTGTVEPDGSLRVRLDPPFRPGGCGDVAGPDALTGRTSGTSITIDFTGRATCEMLRGVPGNLRDVEFAITFTLTPR